MCPLLQEIIKQNIGVERFFKILTEFSLDEMFTETIEQLETGKTEYPQIMDVDFPKILFDRQFCLLYKSKVAKNFTEWNNNHEF